ncbi:MAG: Gfo/Idh/MocA family oxidoreductase [Acidimicrobiales bacterium]|nr:Gfo/Idh/MocA family oxidoreductase [Acidimicrobiales bacterium]
MTGSKLWLVGSGPMATAYAAVLDDLGRDFEVIGRGAISAAMFERSSGHPVRTGGISQALSESPAPITAIVAVTVDQLAETACSLLRAGTSRILLEKPGGLGLGEINSVYKAAENASVVVAYNRRQYASVWAARRAIEDDGGVISFTFEVTEWPHATEPVQFSEAIRQRWFLAQSSHVVDLAFHLGGRPTDWQTWTSGSLPWHPQSARFAGAGMTEYGATFSYHGDWEGPGRWGLEVLTRKRRLVLQPLEELRTMPIGSLEMTTIAPSDDLDVRFKPGVHRQTTAFLNGADEVSCRLSDHEKNLADYKSMAGYP